MPCRRTRALLPFVDFAAFVRRSVPRSPRRSAARRTGWIGAFVAAATLAAAAGIAAPASAQVSSPVTIDDSPWAWELLQRARDQASSNPAEAARLLERVLAEHASQLVPWPEAPREGGDDPADPRGAARPLEGVDRYRSARAAANEILRSRGTLLERWRAIAGPAARRRLDAGDLDGARLTGLLTPAGLEATLRLAQLELEAGRLSAAQRRLEEVRVHPDRRGELATRALVMEGLVAAARRELDDAQSAIAALRAVEGAAETASNGGSLAARGAEAIARLAAEESVPTVLRGAGPLDPSTADVADTLGAPWHVLASVPLAESLEARTAPSFEENGLSRNRALDRLRDRGSLLAIAPTIVGPTVVVNEGATVRSFDRLGGRLRWSRDLGGATSTRVEGIQVADLCSVAAHGDALVTFSGFGTAAGRVGGNRVACLDARSGEVRWSVSLSRLGGGDEFEEVFPVGSPLIADGAVHFLARKVTGRLETVTYVVSLALADGSLRWARHHSSSAGIRLDGQKPMTTLAARDGMLYAAASTGAMACLDATDGEIQWLRRFQVPIGPPRHDATPWEIGAALPADAGVALVAPDQTELLLLDRADGSTLARRPLGIPEAWGQPRYLLSVPGDPRGERPEMIVGVGSDVVAFRADQLGKPQWRLSAHLDPAESGDDDRLGVRGRVQVVGRSLMIPMRTRTLIADLDSGEVRTLVEGAPPGVAVLADHQLLVAASDQLVICMPFDAAERILRERLLEVPDESDRALALLALGVRARSMPLSLEAAEAALRAVDAASESRPARAALEREELVEALLSIDRLGLAASSADGDALHALLAGAARTPRQRATQILAKADHLARAGRRDEAVEAWQALLGDAELRSTLLNERPAGVGLDRALAAPPAAGATVGGDERAAEIAALARIGARRLADPALSEAIERRARAALAALPGVEGQPADRGRIEALEKLAASFPGTAASADAIGEAVDALRRSGAPLAALEAALGAWRALALDGTAPPEVAGRLAGLVVAAAREAGAPARAAAFVESLERGAGPTAGDAFVVEPAGGQPVPLGTLRSGLADAAGVGPVKRPRIGTLSGEATERAGRLLRSVVSAGMSPPAMPSDAVLVYEDGAVKRLDSNLAARWSLPFDDPDPRVLRFDSRGVLLWSATTAEPVAVLVDPLEGRVRWATRRLSEMLPAAAPARSSDANLPAGMVFDASEVLPLCSGDRLLLARRGGDLASMSISAGPEPVWTRRGVLGRIYAAWADDALVLVGGADAAGAPMVVALDAVDGREIVRWTPAVGTEIRWMLAAPSGEVVVATEAALEASSLYAGRGGDGAGADGAPAGLRTTLWRSTRPSARATSRGWVVGPTLLASDALETLSAHRLADGDGVDGFDGASSAASRLRELLVDEKGVTALFEQRVIEFDLKGRVVGMDASADERDYRFVLPTSGGVLVLSALGGEQVDVQGGRRTQYRYRIYALDRDQGCKLVGAALQVSTLGQRVERVAAVDGWLLLSTASAITVIPMSGAP